ncbi:MAG: phosphotransferase [Deltaproteobacteria bacterium]|jgi:ubiquinone biosynthesis protein|nr:phosphotransferase [Deltaproteobacteria bacterium]MBW2534911.1 phosphotransferase [Deltaproteobacteria bacterium]
MVSLVNAVRDIARVREIYTVLVRHGFADLARRLGFGAARPSTGDEARELAPPSGDAAERERRRGEREREEISTAQRVRLVAMDLGPSFVKLGQIASTRPDLLPEDWIVELKKLQDEVTPLPFDDIKPVVESSLGKPLEELFSRFDEEPLAAASVAQVHRAELKHPDGTKQVVVKVQRPGVAQTVARDLDLLHALAGVIERTIPEAHIYSPRDLVEQFDRAITAEMDFTLEAANAKQFADNFAGHPHARFPLVYRQASSKRVLTLELLEGAKIYDAISDHGHDGPTIAKAAAGIIIKMVFQDGFFHADPHPGNILLDGSPEHPVLGLIDLGMVGRLSPQLRDKTVDVMMAAIRKDHESLADAIYAIGTPTEKVDMRAYRAEVARLADKYLNRPLKEIDVSALIADLVKGATRFGLEIPPDFLLVGKALMTIEGIGKEIDPELDILAEARPHFVEVLRKRYAPERIASDAWRGLQRMSGAAYELPQQLREVMDDLRGGRLIVQSRNAESAAMVDRLGRRIVAGLVVSASIVAGAWLITKPSSARWAGVALLCMGALWMAGHLIGDRRRK